MNIRLPRPTDRLANCVWLPRIIAKARLFHATALPEEYASLFGHPLGVDGQFMQFFDIKKEDILAVCGWGDDEIAKWFLSSPFRSQQIREWNQIGINLGRPGFPMAERFPIAVSTNYKHLADQNLKTVFDILEADEQTC